MNTISYAIGKSICHFGQDSLPVLNFYQKKIGIFAATIFALMAALYAIFKYNKGSPSSPSTRLLSNIDPNKKLDVIDSLSSTNAHDFEQKLKRDLGKIHQLEQKLPDPLPGSWRANNPNEKNETLDQYITKISGRMWPNRQPLFVQSLGQYSDTEKKIIQITSDYLNIFHNVPVKICDTALTMTQLRQRYETMKEEGRVEELFAFFSDMLNTTFPNQNNQYEAIAACDMLRTVCPDINPEITDEAAILAFTKEDLYSFNYNFVFGIYPGGNDAIWSHARFGDPHANDLNFEKCLKRVMKISAHEFGHVKNLPHCSDYKCNIGGYNHLGELDASPLLYCLQDTAKICYLTGVNLLDYHKNLLNYFLSFNKTYQVNCDFSCEIKTLNLRIRALETV